MIPNQPASLGPVQKFIATLAGLGVLLLAAFFSLLIIPVLLVAGLAAYGYFRWKTRAIRKTIAEAMAAARADENDSNIIEGEAVVVRDSGAPQLK